MDKSTSILVAGATGLVGSAVVRRLKRDGYTNIFTPTRSQLDLYRMDDVLGWMSRNYPQVVIVAAARVGGIHANSAYPAEFIRQNLEISTNLIEASRLAGVNQLVFLGSSCIYPKFADQPMREDCLLTGELEPTNEAYAIAKIAGLKMCQYYRKQYGVLFHSLMPTNLYGPGDNYHPQNSHVLPALIRRFHEAKANKLSSVTIWGTGRPRREFLHVDDLAGAISFLLGRDDVPDILNVGYGSDVSIRSLAHAVADAVGYFGLVEFDETKPDGTPRKLLDCSKLNAMGWTPTIGLEEGILDTYKVFLNELSSGRLRES